MANKKYTSFVALLIFIFTGVVSFAYAQEVVFDLENLREQDFIFAKAYDNIKIQQAWEAIQDSSTPLSGVVVGVIERNGVDVAHSEFQGDIINGEIVGRVKFGDTPHDARVDNSEDSHPTSVTGIIGANNLSFFKELDPNSPQVTGILAGASPNFDYTLEVREIGPFSFAFDGFKGLFEDRFNGSTVTNMSIANIKRSALTQEQINSGVIDGQLSDFNFLKITKITDFVFSRYDETLFVVAAGNENIDAENQVPANLGDLPNVITVGATDLVDKRAVFTERIEESNFGSEVGISAPGIAVYAPTKGNTYNRLFGGTSASTPFVTGVAGLLKAINDQLTPADIKQILIETADSINTDEPIGPRLNAHSAVCHPDVGLNCQPETGGDSPWPQFQHDSRHTGQSEFQGPQTNNIKWRYPNAQAISVSTPVVGPNDVIYFGMKDENSTDRLIALNSDGSLRFKTTELNSPMSSPAVISNGVVMVVTGAGSQIVAFEDKQAPNEEQPPLWSESVDNNIGNMVLSPNGTLYFVTPGLFLHSYTPTHEGITENWSRVLAQGTSATGTPTLGVGESGNVYLLRTVGFVPPRTRIYIIDPEDGSTVQSFTVSGQPPATSLLVLEDDTIVFGLPGSLRAIDPDTGAGTSVFVPSGINTVPILLPDGNIAIGVKEGPSFPPGDPGNSVVHKIDLNLDNEDDPEILHTIQLGTGVSLGSPVVDSEGTIYITKRTDGGLNPDSSTLFAINSDNTIKFTKDATRFSGSLAMGSNGTLYSSVVELTNTFVANLWAVGE